ncbi:MAG TPA: O-antigen ligase family protein [Mycobacteriales bacterium]|nr:O-antigen ligase family protein [Mycobacteriales bacterium]
MTVLAPPGGAAVPAQRDPAGPARPAGLRGVRVRPDTVAVAVVLADWAWPLTHATGGRSAGVIGAGLVLLLAALGVVRPWEVLARRWTVLAAAVAAGALGVGFVAPGGWSGDDTAASYALAAGTALLLSGWLRRGDTERRAVAAAGILVATGLEQSLRALNTWIAGGTPSAAPVGTFYWHNPFAAFLVPSCIVAAALAVWAVRPLAVLGWVAAPIAAAAVVLSSSRASLGTLVVGWIGLGILAVLHRAGRARRAVRWVIASTACAAASLILPGPPFFSSWHSALGAAEARSAAGETVSANAGYRVQFWHEAWAVFTHHPVAGAGFGRLGTASVGITPAGWARTPYAHNGFLQVLADGGLLLAVPFLLAAAVAVVVGLRRLAGFAGMARAATEPAPATVVRAAGALALLAALAHSAVDNDWSYPSLLIQAGLLLALAASGERREPGAGGRTALALGVVLALLVAAGAGLSLERRRTDHAVARAVAGPSASGIDGLVRAGRTAFAGDQPWRLVLTRALPTDPTAPPQLPAGTVRLALDGTAGAAEIDPVLALQRARAQALLGDRADADATLRRLRDVIRTDRPIGSDAVPVLVATGAIDAARALAVADVRSALQADASDLWHDVDVLGRVPGSIQQYACAGVLAAAQQAIPGGLTAPPTPAAGDDCHAVLDIPAEATS